MPGQTLTDRRSRRPVASWRLASRCLRVGAVSVLGGYLVFLHAELLLRRIESLTLFEPLVALRWLAGLLILAALLRLRGSGASLVAGRRATVVWLLVLVLHSQAAQTAPPPAGEPLTQAPIEAAHLLLALPAAISAVGLFRLVLPLLDAAAASRRARRPLAFLAWRPVLAGPSIPAGFSFSQLSRPPPA